ncbi:HNH endonuclease [Ruegeria sp. AD91A]|uniref:HNH endonuclease n=1 Tax=Ruegeria sp. AD91A TaxID=2293862 RepID=UPI000E4B3682|nr:HNH endonuclease [Ruegeria sp. AD91A]AXT28230.1 HNH endonuclease [Ruegeria sp. AD91A]
MVKAVFIASSHSHYKDRPGEVYHFPKRQYMSRVAQTVGDWVIFYAGRMGGNRGYYAVQRVEKVVDDPVDATHAYAILDRSTLFDFENEVPRVDPLGNTYESGLPPSGGVNASAVRLISDADFSRIVNEGMREVSDAEAIPRHDGFSDIQTPFHVPSNFSEVRERILTSRAFRDASFARQVKRAYQARCAMSGLELRNGGGRPEVEAAHIVPVSENGPDSVQNGMALSGTIHWMFDRGLVSVDEDLSILIAKDSVAAPVADRLFTPERKLIVPDTFTLRPHEKFLNWHRANRFKG